jgi:hypothetical protein
MRGTSGTPRHTKRSRYRCSLPGLAGFAGLRRTEPEVPRIGSLFTTKRLQSQSSTATRAKKENRQTDPFRPLRSHSVCVFFWYRQTKRGVRKAIRSRRVPALKAPSQASPGQRPGFRNQSDVARPERAQESSALSGRTMKSWCDTRGVAPGWCPPRRWRDHVAVFFFELTRHPHRNLRDNLWIIKKSVATHFMRVSFKAPGRRFG